MGEFIIRLVVLFGLAFGVAYGLTMAARSRTQKRLLKELAEARERLASLGRALADGEMNQREHDELSQAILERCRDRGVPLDAAPVPARDPDDESKERRA